MVFPVVLYGYESWTTKEAEHQRTDAFKLWCWRRIFQANNLRLLCRQWEPSGRFEDGHDKIGFAFQKVHSSSDMKDRLRVGGDERKRVG